ncbi:MAG: AAA family ATPase [Candidatus Falkowbacteria bacterium]
MKLIILNGSTCSGKSTIIKNILKKRDHLFHLSYDSLKWSFSNYKPDTHFNDVRIIVLAVAAAVFKMGYDVISDSTLSRESREKLKNLAIEAGYEILEVNLEADFELLSERFDARVASALLNPERRISNLSKDRFVELYNTFNQEKNASALVFRTDMQSEEEISDSIIKLL